VVSREVSGVNGRPREYLEEGNRLVPDSIQGDAQCFEADEKYDFIFAGEIIEHLYNPDGLICSCLRALQPDGLLVITTPNLACVYNRVSLVFGWSLLNYFPSLRFRTGHPAFADKIGRFGPIADHKSVFTWKGFCELLELYGCRVVASRGFSYGDEGELRTPRGTRYKIPAPRLRRALNSILPKTLREGMLFVVRPPKTIDPAVLSGGILQRSVWDR
jgi:SAM-dependent methyltransferase